MASDAEILNVVAVHGEEVKKELLLAAQYQPVEKDILIVVHNQLKYLQACIQSIREETENYHLFVWDNGSDEETAQWLRQQDDIRLIRSEENLGFIIPNNRLIELGNSPYVILLNSDTIALTNWDKALVGYLQHNPDVAQVGYIGGWLTDGVGKSFGYGSKVHYIPGWCFCIPRAIFGRFGLFDEQNLEFAYCEDADFSLRLLDAGWKIHALHLGLVFHHENKTIKEVCLKRDCKRTFDKNHDYIKTKWGPFMRSNRLPAKDL